jgi:hypothetical protein
MIRALASDGMCTVVFESPRATAFYVTLMEVQKQLYFIYKTGEVFTHM